MHSLVLVDDEAHVAVAKMISPTSVVSHATVVQLQACLLSANATTDPTPPFHPVVRDFLTSHTYIAGLDIHCPTQQANDQLRWLQTVLRILPTFVTTFSTQCLLLSAPLATDWDDGAHLSNALITDLHVREKWTAQCGPTSSVFYGDSTHSRRWVALCYSVSTDSCKPRFPDITDSPSPFSSCINAQYNAPAHTLFPFRNSVTHNDNTDQTYYGQPQSNTQHTEHSHTFLPRPLFLVTRHCRPPTTITVYDPMYPCPDHCPAHDATLLQDTFGIPFTDSTGTNHVRAADITELLAARSFPPRVTKALVAAGLPHLALTCSDAGLPFRMANTFARHIYDTSAMIPAFAQHLTSASECVTHCLTYSPAPMPTDSTWSSAYATDPDTNYIMNKLQETPKPSWTKQTLSHVNAGYRNYLRNDGIAIVNNRLVICQDLSCGQDQRLLLIIAPQPLRRLIFSAYHASPTAGHMGEFKTLHRIRTRFFWPRARHDISDWCRQCAHCIATSSSIRKHSELAFSWPVSAPFFILHVVLWKPGNTIDRFTGNNYLLTAMCDLSGFVIAHSVTKITAAHLARVFMQEIC